MNEIEKTENNKGDELNGEELENIRCMVDAIEMTGSDKCVLLFARCNDFERRNSIIETLSGDLGKKGFELIHMDFTGISFQDFWNTLLRRKEEKTNIEAKEIWSLSGLGVGAPISGKYGFYPAINIGRESFRDKFRTPVIFWLDDRNRKEIITRCPDLFDWRSGFYVFGKKDNESTPTP